MSTVIAVANQKGGSAKTTSAIHVAAGLAQLGQKVLLVDMDPQGHAAEGLGIAALELDHEISEVLDRRSGLGAIIRNVLPGLDLAPSNIKLSYVESSLFNKHRREDRLKVALEGVNGAYDYVIIDCPPSLALLTINALSAAQQVLIPMATEFYAMLGVSLLLQTIEEVRAEINPTLSIMGILPTRHGRTVNAREVLERTREELEERIHLYEPIPETVKFREAATVGKTIYEHAPDNPGTMAYKHLSAEVLNDNKG